MAYLLDTNVVSELRKGMRANRGVQAWRRSVAHEETFVSVLVFGELRRGVEKLRKRDEQTARVLERWMHDLQATFAERILPVSLEICDLWGGLSVLQPLPFADGLLAATAMSHDLTFITRNTADFQRTGVDYFNPFTS
jgi:toxin FitB